MEEIFDTKLHTFDVVVFQNFGYAEPALSIASYERNLEQYVAGGGALLVIGGDHAFGEGRAAYPILDRALPVDPSGAPAVVEPFKVKLTSDGLRHPVMRVQTSEGGTQSSWDDLPPASGLNVVRPKQGATVLLDASDPEGRRAAGAGARALGPRPRPRDGADDGRQLDLGLHRAAARASRPATTTGSGAMRSAGWCAIRI